jgi:hypothetical protein
MANIRRIRVVTGGFIALLILAVVPLGVTVVSSAASSSAPEAANSATSAVTQVNIPELGVSLSVPNELRDLKYTVDSTAVPGTTFVYLSTSALERFDDATTRCDATQGAIGAIWRVAQNPATTPDMHYNAAKFVGGSYLVFEAPQGGCSANPTVQKQQMQLVGLLKDVLGSAQVSATGVAQ